MATLQRYTRLSSKAHFALILMFVLCAPIFVGCKNTHKLSTDWFFIDFASLSGAQERWERLGKPSGSELEKIVKPNASSMFVYTNTINVSNVVLHCLFGVRRPDWPGIMVVTETGVTLFVRDRDKKVTIDPQVNGVEP